MAKDPDLRNPDIFIPVFIQEMVGDGDARSGVMFIEPLHTRIQAAFGNNEGVVNGTVTVDSYTVRHSEEALVHTVCLPKKHMIAPVTTEGETRLKTVDVPKSKQNTRVFSDSLVYRLVEIGGAIRVFYGNKDMDVEFTVVRHKQTGNPKIYLLQARPLKAEVAAQPPSYLDSGFVAGNTSAITGQVVLAGGSFVRTIQAADQASAREDLHLLYKQLKSLNEQLLAKMLAGVVFRIPPALSHTAVLLRPMGIPVVALPERTSFTQVKERFQKAGQQAVAVDTQRGVILTATPEDILAHTLKGFTSYPLPDALSVFLTDSFSTPISLENIARHRQIADILETFDANMTSLKDRLSGKYSVTGTFEILIENLKSQSDPELLKAVALALLVKVEKAVLYAMKTQLQGRQFIGDNTVNMLIVADNIREVIQYELIPVLESPRNSLERLYPIKFLELLIYGSTYPGLESRSIFGVLRHIKDDLAVLQQLDPANFKGENGAVKFQLIRLGFKTALKHETTGRQWKIFVLGAKNELYRVKDLVVELGKLKLFEYWLNVVFAREAEFLFYPLLPVSYKPAAPAYRGNQPPPPPPPANRTHTDNGSSGPLVTRIPTLHTPMTTMGRVSPPPPPPPATMSPKEKALLDLFLTQVADPKLKTVYAFMSEAEAWQTRLPQFETTSGFSDALADLTVFMNTYIGHINTLNLRELSSLLLLAEGQLMGKITEVLDTAVKYLKGSSEFDAKTKAHHVATMLQLYSDMVSAAGEICTHLYYKFNSFTHNNLEIRKQQIGFTTYFKFLMEGIQSFQDKAVSPGFQNLKSWIMADLEGDLPVTFSKIGHSDRAVEQTTIRAIYPNAQTDTRFYEQQLEPLSNFNAELILPGKRVDILDGARFPLTLEEYFTIFHQIMIYLQSIVLRSGGLDITIVPENISQLINALNLYPKVEFTGVELNSPYCSIHMNYPMQAHSAQLTFTFDTRNLNQFDLGIVCYGADERFRWDIVAAMVGFTTEQLSLKLTDFKINYDKLQTISWTWTVSPGEDQHYFLRELGNYIHFTFNTTTLQTHGVLISHRGRVPEVMTQDEFDKHLAQGHFPEKYGKETTGPFWVRYDLLRLLEMWSSSTNNRETTDLTGTLYCSGANPPALQWHTFSTDFFERALFFGDLLLARFIKEENWEAASRCAQGIVRGIEKFNCPDNDYRRKAVSLRELAEKTLKLPQVKELEIRV